MSWMAQKELTFLQLFIFPSFLSFLSKQQAPMLPCLGCSADCSCSCAYVCVCQSDESKGLRLGWLMLENTTAPVTHVGLWGLTRLYLTPVHAEYWLLCVRLTHILRDGGSPASNFWAFLLCCSRLLQLSGLHRQYRSDCSDDCNAVDFQLKVNIAAFDLAFLWKV